MAAGRPTEYSEEKLGAAKMYLKNFKSDGEILPTIEGLARALEIRRETVWDWCKDEEKAEFSNVVADIQSEQAKMLINKGLDGTYNPSITKLILSKHGYREASEVDHTSQGERITGINYIVPDGANNKTNK